jgi:RNA polymerase-binding transcription factor DksA
MKQDDFNFFKEFPNIQIRYEKRLHAKYYASESAAILTSMNLYSYSQDNNIEAGVLTKVTLLGDLASSFMTNDTFDNQAWNYFGRVIEQSELLFQKTPQYESAMMGLTKNYKESKVEIDKLSEFFADRAKFESGNRKDTYEKKKVESTPQTQTKSIETGYCIRTGKQIPFNQKRPLSDEAYQSWAKFSKEDYPEKFCHFSGEPSNGETTFAKPILRKHWKKAKETFNL